MSEPTNLHQLFSLPTKPVWDDTQIEAIERCCSADRIVPITGSAGTGKTSIMKEVELRLRQQGYEVQASGPTGKSAKRIKEATGLQAMTNHRMLGYGMPIEQELTNLQGEKEFVRLSTGPQFTRAKRMPWDVILCDEYAMVNTEIHRNLLDAMPNKGRICVFGDVNQLKPIEEDKGLRDTPSPFETLLTKFKGIELSSQHRTVEGSGIAENSLRILKGRPLIRKPDFEILTTSSPVSVLADYVRKAREAGIDYSSTDHQIITCMNKSGVGTKKLNPLLQNLFWNRDHQGMSLPRWKWDTTSPITVQVGSKVVYTANTYDLGNGESVFNGEIGTVVDIDHENDSLDIDFTDRVVCIPPLVQIETLNGWREFDPRCNIDLAYVLSTHKMQGSECQHVIYVLNRATIYGQSRRNFYTAVTRARKHCVIITDSMSMSKSLKYAG